MSSLYRNNDKDLLIFYSTLAIPLVGGQTYASQRTRERLSKAVCSANGAYDFLSFSATLDRKNVSMIPLP